MKSVLVFTSNIINWSSVQKKKYSKPSEEVIECCRSVIKCKRHCGNLEESNNCIRIECEKHRDLIDIKPDHDIRITVKIFLFSCNVEDVKEAFENISQNIMTSFSTVILSIPKDTRIAQLLPVWQYLESKVNENKVWRLGVSDMELPQLEVLCKVTTIGPNVNQVHNNALCSVPQNIKNFANTKDIELLSHSDDIQNISNENLNSMLKSELSLNTNWSPGWIVKYSTIYNNRSVIRSLGYIVKAFSNLDNGHAVQPQIKGDHNSDIIDYDI